MLADQRTGRRAIIGNLLTEQSRIRRYRLRAIHRTGTAGDVAGLGRSRCIRLDRVTRATRNALLALDDSEFTRTLQQDAFGRAWVSVLTQ